MDTREPLRIAKQIESTIETIRAEGKRSEALIQAKAETMRVYDKAVAVTSATLRAGGMPVGMIKDQAKGDASQLMCEMTVATETLKAHWHRLEYLKAQLNGYQSINRHLDST